MKTKFIILFFILPFVFFACEEVYENFTVKDYKPNIVIEGIITDANPPHYVKIMETVVFGDSMEVHYIPDAQVILSDNIGNREILSSEKTGIYRSDSILGKPGNTYKIEVRIGNSVFTSTCKIAPMINIDSIVPYFRGKTGLYKEDGYYIHLYGQKPQEDSTNYYKFNFFQNGHLITNHIYSNLISDEGSSLKQEFDLDNSFNLNDTIDLEIFSLTRENFEYFLDVNELISSDSYVFEYHRNPLTNISNGALGYFQASAYKKIRVIAK